ncbi:adenylate/guanylate cyclase domain-containing protein [Herbidospora sp. NEAU-GS84]|uniref:Adenylate/guanylate cyclase domain-containing protein n=1 Tax=Herbidospora solisilvae TaxID=2696284 RepID=A0A7C9NBQ4_9ACTN|nr:adenylate/guanylate cyclase domain-containing protein [Herbidospora solisilvae]NAS20515.1 adenylate/guanylate cyclase domain-containing protein [Herbidospora solisilvae]
MTIDDPRVDGLTEAFLRQHRRYTSHQVAELAGVPFHRARRFWRALGFANVADDAIEFTDADVEALKTLMGLLADGTYDDEHIMLMARSLGRASARLAESQAELGAETLDLAGVPLSRRSHAWQRRADRVVPDLERLLVYAWRRHLAASAGRIVDQETASTRLAVGFADLVGFTRLSRQISETELARLVERFESRSADIVASSGGRMIKTLGDSVLWVSDTAAHAADIALSLVGAHARVKGMPQLRVGLAIGPVIGRMGDVFGTTVNLASRLTSLAPAGGVLADPAIAGELEDHPRFGLRAESLQVVRGVGELVPYLVSRA